MTGKKVQWVGDSKLQKAIPEAAQVCMIQLMGAGQDEADLFALHTPTTANYEVTPPLILQLLGQFEDLFEEPMDLPPSRGIFDHKIPLIHGSTPVSIRPYRCPLKQRDIIKSLVQEMLDKGIVQHALALLLVLWC